MMPKRAWFFGIATAFALAGWNTAWAGVIIYASDRGQDQAPGTSTSTAVRTLERARDIARKYPGPRTIIMTGRFPLTKSLMLSPRDSNTEWRGQGSAVIYPAVPLENGIATYRTSDIAFRNFQMQGFGERGIFIQHAARVTISGLTVRDTQSTKWSTAGINLVGALQDISITENRIVNSGYNGIGLNTVHGFDVKRININGNIVVNSCLRVSDCGGIYVSGRSRTPLNSIIFGNLVYGYGNSVVAGRGIYLDDWASFVLVQRNCLIGKGLYGIHVHGGNNNTIANNSIEASDSRSAVYNQTVNSDPNGDMSNNIFENNTVYGVNTPSKLIFNRISSPRQQIQTSGNIYPKVFPDNRCQSMLAGLRSISDLTLPRGTGMKAHQGRFIHRPVSTQVSTIRVQLPKALSTPSAKRSAMASIV